MKLASYVYHGRPSYGVVQADGVADVPALWPDGPQTLLAALQTGDEALTAIAKLAKPAARRIPLADIRLMPPLPQPPKLIGLAVNYGEHHKEIDRGHVLPDDPKLHTTPRPFLMPSTCVIGPGEQIPWPSYSKQIDYEIELAVVIGVRRPSSHSARRPSLTAASGGGSQGWPPPTTDGLRIKCVSPEQARECIAGYTIANDVSARSCTFAEGRTKRPKDDFFDWLNGKWADGFCPLGPWIVTADEIPDPMNLKLELTVNGQVRQQASTAAMIFDVFELVSFISHIMTLTPGDVIATGTPSGVGMATGNFLHGGDVITCRIEKLGELSNTLGQPPKEFYTPCERGTE